MLAIVPDGRGSVRMDEVADPSPKPDEAVVDVGAYSVNRGETFLLTDPAPGWRPGKDVAGCVAVAAADGSGPAVGTRVVAHLADSGWAQRVAVQTASLVALPVGVEIETAAVLPLAGLTALRLLRRAGDVSGKRLLITGASGGVGHYLTELASAAGAAVTAVVATPERGARLRELGAEVITDVRDDAGRFDVVLESVGGESFVAARRRARPDGLVIWFGQASGQPITLDFFDWIDGTIGAPVVQFIYTRSDRSEAEDLAELVALVEADGLHPEIGSARRWTQTADVIEDIRGRRLRGNAVLTVD